MNDGSLIGACVKSFILFSGSIAIVMLSLVVIGSYRALFG